MPISLQDLAEKYVAEALSNDWASSDDPNGVWRRRGSQAADERRLTDLTSARNLTRRLLEGSQYDDGNEYAIGAATNRVNYVVGDAGIKYEIVPARGKQVPPELLAQAADWLDRFREANDLAALERETVWRLDRDGEAFLRLFPCEGCPEVAFVQPELVYPPAGGAEPVGLVSGLSAARAGESVPSLVAPWGILRPADNQRRIVGYWVDRGDGLPVVVPEADIVHLKLNVTSEFERGWPTFEPVRRALLRAEELLVAMTASGKVRAKIALITTIPGWTAAKADSLKAQLTTKYQDQPNGEPPRQETIEELPYGAHLRVRDGTNIAFPPPGLGANEIVEAIQANLRAAGSRLVMPEWMFTLLADAKYSNAFVVEAPTLRMFQSLQGLIVQGVATGRYKERTSLIRRAMRMSAERGDLPAEVLTLCEIKATAPSLETRDKSAEASANVAYIGAGVKPVALVQQELGIDPDEAKKLAEKYAAQPPAPAPTDPTAPPPEPVPPDAAPPQPDPTAAPVAEALARIVAEWFSEGGAARAGGLFPDAEHFGVSEEGEPWVSESAYALVSEAGKQGLVAKKIKRVSSKGKPYEMTVWVRPGDAKANPEDAKRSPVPQKPEPPPVFMDPADVARGLPPEPKAPPPVRDVKLGEKPLPKSKATVTVENAANEQATDILLGRVFSGGDAAGRRKAVAESLGLPDDAKIKVTQAGGFTKEFTDDSPKAGARGVRVQAEGPDLGRVSRFVGVDGKGKKFIRNEVLEIKGKGAGKGTEIFAKQVESASANGVDYIETHAIGSFGTAYNGYYTWPALGYNAPVPRGKKGDKVRAVAPGVRSIQDLFDRPSVNLDPAEVKRISDKLNAFDAKSGKPPKERTSISGSEWWKVNGFELRGLRFDLTPESRSMKVLKKYLAKKSAPKETPKST